MTITTDPLRETPLFSDEPRMIAEMLRDNWSLGPDDIPTISFVPEEYMTTARVAFIYVYQISRYNSVSTTDYRTLQRTSFLAIRMNTRFRHKAFEYMQEIYRIIMAHRRIGQPNLGGYTYMEIINDRMQNDLSGWYSATMDVKLTSYAYPLRTHGFGNFGGESEGEIIPPEDDEPGDEPGGDTPPPEEDKESNERKWADGIPYTLGIVNDEYVDENTGAFKTYTGWSRTRTVYCGGASSIYFPPCPEEYTRPNATYTALYDSDGNRVMSFNLNKDRPTVIQIPAYVDYFAISSTTDALHFCVENGIIPYKNRVEDIVVPQNAVYYAESNNMKQLIYSDDDFVMYEEV